MNSETAREDRDGAREMAEGDGATRSLGIARHDLDDEGRHDKEIKGLTPSGHQSGASQSSPPAAAQREARPKRKYSWPGNTQRKPSPASDTASYASSLARSSSESPPSSMPASRPGSANKSYDTSAPETPYSRHFSPVPETGPKTVSSAALSINPSRSTDDIASRIQMVRFHQRR